MTAKDQLSELELDLHDNRKETLNLNHELDEVKATHHAMKAQMEEVVHNENGDLEEEASSLFDKVNIAMITPHELQMTAVAKKFQSSISNIKFEYFAIVDDC